jgi:uncharacterized membrane protein YeaQ/YmgE (transglycosylase-associated protein family)
MSFLSWLILGLLSGFIASKIVNKQGSGTFIDIVLGVIGAVVGGFLFHLVGATGVTGFDAWSLLVSVVGAVVLLVAYHAVTRRRVA